MGGAAVAVGNDPLALRANPSLAALSTIRTLSVAYAPAWMGLPELSLSTIAFCEPFSFGAVGVSVSRFGFALYRETTLSAMAGLRLGEQFGIGVTVNAFHLAIERYGSAWTLGLDAGAVVLLSPELLFGIAVTNLSAPRIGACRERLPEACTAGISYRPLGDLTLTLEASRESGFPLGIRGGASCELLGCFALRAGMSDGPETWSAGCGLTLGAVALDYALTTHPALGMSHHLSLTLFLEFQ